MAQDSAAERAERATKAGAAGARGLADGLRRRRKRLWAWLGGGLAAIYGLALFSPVDAPIVGGLFTRIQNDRTEEVTRDLEAAGFADLDVTFDGRVATIRGDIAESDVETVRDIAIQWGVRDAKVESTGAPAAAGDAPIVDASGTLADGDVVLRGEVLSDGQRQSIVDAALDAFGADNVTDELTVVDGVDAVVAADADDAVAGLATAIAGSANGFVTAEASLRGDELTFVGEAESDAARDALLALLDDGVDASITVAAQTTTTRATTTTTAVVVPDDPVEASVVATIVGGATPTVTLTGEVPSQQQKDRIVAAAVEVYGEANVTDRLTVTAPPPANADDADDAVNAYAGLFAPTFGRWVDGILALQGGALTATGTAADADGLGVIGTVLDGASGLTVTNQVTGPEASGPSTTAPPTQIEEDISEILGIQNIQFDTGSAEIRTTDGSIERLDRVAAVLLANPGSAVTITGHTDDVGSNADNQALSEARANTVRNYLIAAGIDGAQLTAVGAGESQPIADNATAEGKQTNRRIEFSVG
jgi:OmpA-OmpF porin, OOP family